MSNNGSHPYGNPPAGYGGYPQPAGYGGYPSPSSSQIPRQGIPAHPRRSGKALPIAVAMGLAVGVFLGLILVRGTGSAEADDQGIAAADTGDGGAVADDTVASDAGAAVATATMDAGAAAAAADAAAAVAVKALDAAPAAPATAEVTFDIKPSEPAGLSITVDDLPVSGTSHTVALENGVKTINVVVKANGYRAYARKFTIREAQTITVRLHKAGGGSRPKPPTGNGPGSIIDL